MTLNPDDLDLLPDDVEDVTAAPEEDVSLPDTPEEAAPEAAPEAPAPAPDPWEKINRLADLQTQQIELQRQQLERQNQPAAPAAYVDPYDRAENVTRLDELEDRASYDPEARAQLRSFRRQMDDERLNHQLGQREQALRAEMQAAQQVETVTQTLRNEARQYGDLVNDDALTEVQNEVFAGQPAHVRANALQDPSLRALIVQAAAGRRVLNGQTRPPTAPARPTAPPAVRSDSRAPAPKTPKQAEVNMWLDRDYLESTLDETMFGKPRTADHEELLK